MYLEPHISLEILQDALHLHKIIKIHYRSIIQTKCGEFMEIIRGILSNPHNIVIVLNNSIMYV